MLFSRDPKQQNEAIPLPGEQKAGIIVSSDTHRAERVPPGQSRTLKWPVLDASGPPRIDTASWKLEIDGLVNRKISFTWAEFLELPRVKVFADFHCVTRWSRLGNVWEGVSVATLLGLADGPKPEAKFVVAHGYDAGWTTNLPLDVMMDDELVLLGDGDEVVDDLGVVAVEEVIARGEGLLVQRPQVIGAGCRLNPARQLASFL